MHTSTEHYDAHMLTYAHASTSMHMYVHASVHAFAFLQSPGTSVVSKSNELYHTHKLQHNNSVESIYIYAALPQSYVGHVYR